MARTRTENMAVYNPHLLSHKLCRVLDSGAVTVDEFARQCELAPSFIERVARGGDLKLERETQFQIEKVLSVYFRRDPSLYRDKAPASKRGVVEVVLRSRDWRGFEVTDSTGAIAMYVEWPRKSVTQARIDGLWRWLDKEDPQPMLRIL